MTRRLAISIAACVATVSAIAAWGAEPETPPAPLVEVGSRVVDESALTAWLARRFPDADPANPSDPLRRAALLGLVRRQLALQTLLDAGGASLAARIERRRTQTLDRLRRIDADAVLPEHEAEEIAWEVAWSEYLERHLSEKNLERFYEAHRWRFDGTRARVSQIFLPPTEREEDVRRRADEWAAAIGDDQLTFAEAARRYSAAPSAAEGGMVGWITASGDLPPVVAEAALTGDLQSLIGPIRSTLGWHLVWVEQREPGETPFEEFADRAALRRLAADYLFACLVRTAAATTEVRWIREEVKPPAGVDVVP